MKRRLAAVAVAAAMTPAPADAALPDKPPNRSVKELERLGGPPSTKTRYWKRPTQQALRNRMMRRITTPYRGWLAGVRACESGGNYGTNTGNGFFGAYQFTLSSWAAVGGWGYPHLAAPLEQDFRAVKLLHLQGPGAWPNCA